MPARLGELLGGKAAFIVIASLAFAACFALSDFGTVRHLRWLNGWPPLLFIFVVPPEYRWRFGRDPWARDVFVAMTAVTCSGLAIDSIVEAVVYQLRVTGTPALADMARLVSVVALGGLLFGLLSLFSAWGLYSLFYRPDGPVARHRTKPPVP
jgi:hypothetical protein